MTHGAYTKEMVEYGIVYDYLQQKGRQREGMYQELLKVESLNVAALDKQAVKLRIKNTCDFIQRHSSKPTKVIPKGRQATMEHYTSKKQKVEPVEQTDTEPPIELDEEPKAVIKTQEEPPQPKLDTQEPPLLDGPDAKQVQPHQQQVRQNFLEKMAKKHTSATQQKLNKYPTLQNNTTQEGRPTGMNVVS